MTLRRVNLPADVPGRLWLSAMPGRLGDWERWLDETRRRDVSVVLCLTPRDEVARMSPPYDRAITRGELPFAWLNLPMRNYGLPLDMQEFRAGIEHAAAELAQGRSVLLHCAAGIGRTGSAAACVLKRLGATVESALAPVREAGSSPENAVQSGMVDWF